MDRLACPSFEIVSLLKALVVGEVVPFSFPLVAAWGFSMGPPMSL